MDLVVDVYALTRAFPIDERFALTSQTRRAVVSVPANIAEGRARESRREYAHHISIARGSVAELETELLIAERLAYLKANDLVAVLERIDHISRMLTNLRRKLTRT